jgi:tRNA threonylcarbamoyladenosine biosynthesis protein TsaB
VPGHYIIRFKMMSNQGFAMDNDPLILALDTSSPVAAYAIARGGQALASINFNTGRPHSQTFFSTLAALCDLAGMTIGDMDLLAAVTGPGSFTGLRVGLAAAQGLADSLGIPCLGVNALDALALQANCGDLSLITMSAGRHEVYCGLRQVNEGQVETVGEDRVCPPSSIMSQFRAAASAVTLVADCGREAEAALEWPGRVLRFDRSSANLAVTLARAAEARFRAGIASPLAAYYIRPSDAEIKKGPAV